MMYIKLLLHINLVYKFDNIVSLVWKEYMFLFFLFLYSIQVKFYYCLSF